MKPVRFALERPRELVEALELLETATGVVKVLAGGQSLGPMLNLRLVEPDLVVDIAGLPELRRCEREGGTLVLGACVTHADIEDGRAFDVGGGALARVASGIAYRAVRNRGTIGGSLAHADPAADWLTALSLIGAEVELASRGGRRKLPLAQFVRGALETALRHDELLIAVRIDALSPTSGFGYVKHARKIGEFAHAIGAALLDLERGEGRAVIGAVDAAPIVIADARVLFGGRIDAGLAQRFDCDAVDAMLRASGMEDRVDRHVHVEMVRRACLQAARPALPNAKFAA
jgi:carbon-monoxide dehydrogenase medium subunit